MEIKEILIRATSFSPPYQTLLRYGGALSWKYRKNLHYWRFWHISPRHFLLDKLHKYRPEYGVTVVKGNLKNAR